MQKAHESAMKNNAFWVSLLGYTVELYTSLRLHGYGVFHDSI